MFGEHRFYRYSVLMHICPRKSSAALFFACYDTNWSTYSFLRMLRVFLGWLFVLRAVSRGLMCMGPGASIITIAICHHDPTYFYLYSNILVDEQHIHDSSLNQTALSAEQRVLLARSVGGREASMWSGDPTPFSGKAL